MVHAFLRAGPLPGLCIASEAHVSLERFSGIPRGSSLLLGAKQMP